MTSTETRPMTMVSAIGAIIRAAAPAPVVFAAGHPSRIASGTAGRPDHFYLTGSAGWCAPIATGVALTTRSAVVAVDDGRLRTTSAAIIAAGRLESLPLVHVLLDDGADSSVDGRHLRWAKAAGYRAACVVASEETLAAAVRSAVALAEGPLLIRCPVERPADDAGRR